MRITRDSLLRLARDIAALRFRQERDVVCIYMTGSMRQSNPLLGGSADIDLVFVHTGNPPENREVQKISEDVTLDIAHLPQSVFEQPRRLRADPWLGSFLCENPILLQENQHWFEFTQAAVCSAFYAPETVLSRVRALAGDSRGLWLSLQAADQAGAGGGVVRPYLKAVEQAVNACACLYGPPLTERRFLLDFSILMENQNQPALSLMAKSLVNNRTLDESFWSVWLEEWKKILAAAGSSKRCPKKLSPLRNNYYIKACEALQADNPAASLWILMKTWSLAEEIDSTGEPWQRLCSLTGFDPEDFASRLESLDQFLDIIDEMTEKWARFNGLE